MVDDERARLRESLDDAGSAADPETAASRYLACVREATSRDDRDPDWLPWLVGDALARTVRADESPFGDRESQIDLVASVAALAVHHRWREVDDLELDGDEYFEQIVTGLRTVASDDRGFVERVVKKTATLLDEEYPGTAVLDWQDAFDAG
jgi:hypothetical protein